LIAHPSLHDPRQRRRALVETLGGPTLLVIAYFVLPFDGDLWPLAVLVGILAAILLIPLTIRRAKRIQESDTPLLEAVHAVALAASLAIISFSISYYTLATTTTGQIPGIETKIDALYFTVVTLATVGYGDITPQGQGARALVTAQILLNITLIATSFRVLSRLALERSGPRHPGGAQDS
jgi:voltage-gated potassium channel Kch